MPHTAIEQVLSPSRFSTYRNAVITAKGSDCPRTALDLYEWNADLSGQLLFPLHIYEVVLRNTISDAISQRYGPDWPINTVFQNSLPNKEKAALLSLITPYQGLGKTLPELKLYWFESMLTRRHDGRIWKPYIHSVFPNAGGDAVITAATLRSQLNTQCRTIRKLRNRIAHHEPIFNQPMLANILPYIQAAVGFRCATTLFWLNKREQVSPLLLRPVV